MAERIRRNQNALHLSHAQKDATFNRLWKPSAASRFVDV